MIMLSRCGCPGAFRINKMLRLRAEPPERIIAEAGVVVEIVSDVIIQLERIGMVRMQKNLRMYECWLRRETWRIRFVVEPVDRDHLGVGNTA